MKTLVSNVLLALVLAAVTPAHADDRTAFHSDAESVRPLLPGMQAPALALTATDGATIDFTPGRHGAPVVLTFYRGGWCPYCNLHLAELRTAEAELRELGFEVWFVSPDRPEMLAEGETEASGYRLLSDPELAAARAFGIAFRLDDDTLERYAGFGVDLADRSGADHGGLPAPATFLVGTDGIIQFAYVNPDYSVRLAPEVLLAAARAYADGAHRRLQRGRR
ncbi:AhpC/TSA family protein [Wenzhouxiangella sp. XN79A]|uniref:peroxiredoxin-like family protein n=1 Tax=Wenzhouxiangella sp. XN79A TaxID=2724193 RepID=UPI00144A88FE|nr:peroxiredoxin-like family protein [Wenzhouxiangella sp. XN79A]NKI35824.1 AhpC/TSA family protein [Wenzhouxiangella sp. XN79A]